ncbi:MAG TPA: hypothetical protein VFC79_00295, partial [Tissierellaceae bacterium]|nr:hypothetical protein [Tissierellaceae bacterium]
VRTGILESEEGDTWINLNNGEFNLQNKITFINDEFHIELEAEDIEDIITDISPHNIILSNEYQGFSTDNNGVQLYPVTIETSIGTYRGTVRKDAVITDAKILNSDGLVITVGDVTITNPTTSSDGTVEWKLLAGQFVDSDEGWIDILINIENEVYNKKVKWSKIKTAKDGIDGSDGEYIHIMYSQNANGVPMTSDPTDAKYIGVVATDNPSPPTTGKPRIRYVRVKQRGGWRGLDWQRRFSELKVMVGDINVALNKTVTSTHEPYYSNSPLSDYVDGDFSTVCTIKEDDISKYVPMTVDLGQVYTNVSSITQLAYFWGDGSEVPYIMEVSENNANWIKIYDHNVDPMYVEVDGGRTFPIDIISAESQYKWTQIKGDDGESGMVANILPTASHFTSNTIDPNTSNYIYTPSMIKLNIELQNCEYRGWQWSRNGTTWYDITSGTNGLT